MAFHVFQTNIIGAVIVSLSISKSSNIRIHFFISYNLDDQTCGNFRECKGDSESTISIIVIVTTIGSVILIAICVAYIRYRCSRRTHNNQMMHISSTNQGAPVPIFLFPNSLTTQPNSYGEVHPIPMSSATTFNREEPPPNYDAAILSSTIQNQNKV
jgi:hypothetical protein